MGKHEIGVMRWKTCGQCQGWEACGGKREKNVQSVSSAGKDAVAVKGGKEATGAKLEKARNWAKRGKILNRCQARENRQPVPSAGKHTTGVKPGKTSNRCKARESTQPVPNTGNK